MSALNRTLLKRLLLAICVAAPVAAEAPPAEPPLTPADREYWSFRPLAPAMPPVVKGRAWSRNAIDRFVLQKLEEHNLAPMPECDRATLLRRVTCDLTGLPPTPDEQRAFDDDQSPEAFERVVDRLLAGPAYAERWAQHWLDAARYADTDGFELDAVRGNAWKYRDWVINAFGEDLPYREFVTRQLAGDLTDPDDPDARIATGFLLCGPDMPDINSQDERRHNFLNDLTATVGQVFLGLQMGCASCHDHKYDPISQYDFYRLRAFFEPCDLFREQPVSLPEERAAIERFEQERALQWMAIEEERSTLKRDGAARNDRLQELTETLADLKKQQPPPVTMARAVQQNPTLAPARFYVRGDFRHPGPEVRPDFPRVANPDDALRASGTEGALDRADLSRWITDPDNALAARVIVNRVWQFHFGRGLCDTPNDLGFMGGIATHPELLDWLAAEFQRTQGSFKALHRLIVTSATYRTQSRPADNGDAWNTLVKADGRNRWLGRMDRRRLDGESIRDSMIAVSGGLNLERGGPGFRPPLPVEVVSTLLKDQWAVTPDPGQHTRRSIYLFVRRNLRYPLFDVFDRPDTNQSCPRRYESTTAPQALTLLNSEFTWDCASNLAERIRREAGSDAHAQVDLASRLVLGRPANSNDFAIAELESDFTVYCAALFNSSEFLYVD